MQARRKNMERMAEVVPESDDQVLQHFLSNSRWDERGSGSGRLGGRCAAGWHAGVGAADRRERHHQEGQHSVGVARQWNGRLGKVDNCQVGVFAALSRGPDATLIDTRLYLPKCWTNDAARCAAVGVPKAARELKSKPQLALEMVRHNRRLGVRFAWVGMDGLYGKDPALLRALERDGATFVADVHKDQRIDLADPRPRVPATTPGAGVRAPWPSATVRVDASAGHSPTRPEPGHVARQHQGQIAGRGAASTGLGYGTARKTRRVTGI